MADKIQRFSFAELPMRGEVVSLTETIQTICDQHNYPAQVRQLLAEALAACTLLTDIIKIEGRISLQLQSQSLIKLLLVDCDHLGHIRGVLQTNEQLQDQLLTRDYYFADWIQGGQMAITIEPDQGQRYQGVVPLDKPSLAECLEDYFNLSEQLPTRIQLFANQSQAFGIFLQAMPEDASSTMADSEAMSHVENAFEHLTALVNTISEEEAFSLSHHDLLFRLFHQDQVSLYPEKAIRFKCNCSREKNINALTTLDPSDLMSLVEEQDGEIEMVCDFCSNAEIFNRQQIIDILTNEADQGAVN